MLQEMIMNLIHIPRNYLSLFTVFSQYLWHRALGKKKRVTNTQQQYKHTEVKLYFVHPDLHKTSLLACKQGMN